MYSNNMTKINETLKRKIHDLMLKNKRNAGYLQYTVPSPSTYPYQWLWDSCFNAIILSYFDINDAKKELLSVVSKQFENGLIPHMIYWEKGPLHNYEWGNDGTSAITQPPVIGYSVLEIFKKDKDKIFLQKMYPALKKYTDYLLSQRDPRGSNLIGIISPDESGEDNSPRFDIPLGMSANQTIKESLDRRIKLIADNKKCHFDAPFCMRNYFWVKDVPFNVIMISHLKAVAFIAKELGESKDHDLYSHQVKYITTSMRKFMFEDGLFWSVYGTDYKKIKITSWAIFVPLFEKLYTQDEADSLVKNYLLNDSEFNLKFLLPTVSKKEESFDPEGFWRGPVWFFPNWFVYKGLVNYGFNDLAEKILQSSLILLETQGFREYFNPLTGKGLGAKDFTWGGLVLDMQKV